MATLQNAQPPIERFGCPRSLLPRTFLHNIGQLNEGTNQTRGLCEGTRGSLLAWLLAARRRDKPSLERCIRGSITGQWPSCRRIPTPPACRPSVAFERLQHWAPIVLNFRLLADSIRDLTFEIVFEIILFPGAKLEVEHYLQRCLRDYRSVI